MATTYSSLLTLEQALATMLDAVDPVTVADTDNVPLPNACGRISVEPIVSPVNVPPFDNPAMNGYAVRLADLNAGRSPAWRWLASPSPAIGLRTARCAS